MRYAGVWWALAIVGPVCYPLIAFCQCFDAVSWDRTYPQIYVFQNMAEENQVCKAVHKMPAKMNICNAASHINIFSS